MELAIYFAYAYSKGVTILIAMYQNYVPLQGGHQANKICYQLSGTTQSIHRGRR